MSRKDENILAWTLATIGLLGAGFAAGLHRLIWGLFSLLIILWWLLIWYNASNDIEQWWILAILAIVPPIVIGIVVRIVEVVAVTFFGVLNESKSTNSKGIEK